MLQNFLSADMSSEEMLVFFDFLEFRDVQLVYTSILTSEKKSRTLLVPGISDKVYSTCTVNC